MVLKWKEIPEAAKQSHFSYIKKCDKHFLQGRRILTDHIRIMRNEHKLDWISVASIVGETPAEIKTLYRYGPKKGISKSTRTFVKRRDKNECSDCGKKEGRLHIHHIGNPENQRANNLVLLCPFCHKQRHKQLKSSTV